MQIVLWVIAAYLVIFAMMGISQCTDEHYKTEKFNSCVTATKDVEKCEKLK
jgi:hypothetical protein